VRNARLRTPGNSENPGSKHYSLLCAHRRRGSAARHSMARLAPPTCAHARRILLRPEEHDAAARAALRLHALEHALAVIQHLARRGRAGLAPRQRRAPAPSGRPGGAPTANQDGLFQRPSSCGAGRCAPVRWVAAAAARTAPGRPASRRPVCMSPCTSPVAPALPACSRGLQRGAAASSAAAGVQGCGGRAGAPAPCARRQSPASPNRRAQRRCSAASPWSPCSRCRLQHTLLPVLSRVRSRGRRRRTHRGRSAASVALVTACWRPRSLRLAKADSCCGRRGASCSLRRGSRLSPSARLLTEACATLSSRTCAAGSAPALAAAWRACTSRRVVSL